MRFGINSTLGEIERVYGSSTVSPAYQDTIKQLLVTAAQAEEVADAQKGGNQAISAFSEMLRQLDGNVQKLQDQRRRIGSTADRHQQEASSLTHRRQSELTARYSRTSSRLSEDAKRTDDKASSKEEEARRENPGHFSKFRDIVAEIVKPSVPKNADQPVPSEATGQPTTSGEAPQS